MKNKSSKLITILAILMLLNMGASAIAEVVSTLALPSALKIIEEEAFAGNTSIEKVIVPDGTTEIRSKAFANSSMTELVLPNSLSFIADDAFEGCGAFLLTVPENCYAYDRCVELGLIEQEEPNPSVIESAHPYPDDFDYTWIYDAGEGTESVTITFSVDTETEEDWDFIYIYTLDDVEVGKYSGTELTGQSVAIDGTGFKLRLTSDSSVSKYGFKLDSIVCKKAGPLVFESIVAESSIVNAGDTIRWTVTTNGGNDPIYYDYTILLGEEEVATGTVEALDVIEYMPIRAGEYRLSVIARDSGTTVLPMQRSDAVVVAPSTAYPESAHPYARNMDQSWVYAAEENVECLIITFSEETRTDEDFDYIYLYDQNNALLGQYDGTTLAGKTIEIQGSAFRIRLTSDTAIQRYGFSITNIEKHFSGPLTFVSLTADKTNAQIGDLITWTMETVGGSRPVTYEYTITLNGEVIHSSYVIQPEQIFYVPMAEGNYILSIDAIDAKGNTLPTQISQVSITGRDTTAPECFIVEPITETVGMITGYIGDDTVVVIPNVIDGLTIESIAPNAFEGNTDITSVAMPASLKNIGHYAFSECTNLQGVSLNSGLETIGYEAFSFSGLKSIALPDSIQSIDKRVFMFCTELESSNWPKDIVSIPHGTFDGCNKLREFLFFDGLKEIGDFAFYKCSGLQGLGLPSTLEKIGIAAFRECSNITEAIIPDSVTSMGAECFGYCDKLKEFTLPKSLKECPQDVYNNWLGGILRGTPMITEVVIPEGITEISDNLFWGCDNIETIVLPTNCTSIGTRSFDGCSITSIDLPSTLKSIGSYAFASTDLKELYLPSNVQTIGDSAFGSCVNLAEVSLSDSLNRIGHHAFAGCPQISSIDIPSSVRYIGEAAFSGTALKTVVIPEGVEAIGSGAFYCDRLTSISLPSTWKTVPTYYEFEKPYDTEGIVRITDELTIKVAEGLKRIPDCAFAGEISTDDIVSCPLRLPDSVEEIGDYAFFCNNRYSDFYFPKSLRKVGDYAFAGWRIGNTDNQYYQTSYERIILPSSLEYIGKSAFMSSGELSYVYIPESVSYIGENAFAYCPELKIYCEYGSVALQHAMDNDIPYFYLSLVNPWLPSGTIYMGDDNHIGGMIRCSDPITKAEVKLYNANGEVIRSGVVENNATLISLGAYLDRCIDLPTLPLGTYSIEVSASATEESETFIHCQFTIVRPPLRTNIVGCAVPSGLYDIGEMFQLKGTIQSNYLISSITAGVYNQDGTATALVKTISPNTTSYDLSNLASTAQIETLSDGKYTYRIIVVSDGKTVMLKNSSFGVGTACGEGIDDEELAQMLVFGAKPENKLIFAPLTYHNDYLNSLSVWEAFQVALVSGREILSSSITDAMTSAEYNSYAVDLYKAQIASAIEDLINSGYTGNSDLKLYKVVTDGLLLNGQILDSNICDYLQSLEADYGVIKESVNLLNYDYTVPAATYAGMLQLGEVIKNLDFISKNLSTLSDVSDVLEIIFRDYEAGTKVLDTVENALGQTGNPSFDEAMRRIRKDYTDMFVAIAHDQLYSLVDTLKDKIISEVVQSLHLDSYKVYTQAIDLTFKLSGFEGYTDSIMDFTTGTVAFNNAERAYMKAFDRVYGGDHSEEALRQLLICFNFTYSCADNLYYTLYDLSPASKKAEVLSHINNDLRPISIWN